MTPQEFDDKISGGWMIFESIIPRYLVDWMLIELAEAYELCRAIQIRNGVEKDTEYTVHHLIGQGRSFLECLRCMPNNYIERYFGGPFILNSFGGALNQAHSKSYAHEIHRDQRSFSKDRMMLNTLVMLDDFTADNGATRLMPRSHKLDEKPSQTWFDRDAALALAPSGSVLVFDSRLWHAGGENKTDRPRRSVTPMYSKPWIKPQFDYCRALGHEWLSPELEQIVGYNARIPSTLDEWYQLEARRCYRASQG